MLSDACRAALPILAAAHLSVLLWTDMPEMYSCINISLPPVAVLTDVAVSRDRAARGVYFHAASIVEVVLMIYIVVRSRRVVKRHDLGGNDRWMSVLLIVVNMAARARYVFSTPLDMESCDRLMCPTTPFSSQLGGCQGANGVDAFYIDWNDRDNWCPTPKWYRDQPYAATLCGGLANIPDITACYRYGCTPLVPARYSVIRLLIWSSFLFALASLVPYTMEGSTLTTTKQNWRVSVHPHEHTE